jgi:hypothetical protein
MPGGAGCNGGLEFDETLPVGLYLYSHQVPIRDIYLEARAVREVLVSRHNEKWPLSIRLGGAGSRWLPVRSRREAATHLSEPHRLGRFAEAIGMGGLCRRAVKRFAGAKILPWQNHA